MTAQRTKTKKKRASKRGVNGRNDFAHAADIVINGSVHIPPWVIDHDSFRRWACSDEFPEHGRYSWLGDKLWIEVHSELLDHLSDADVKRMRAKAFDGLLASVADGGMDVDHAAAAEQLRAPGDRPAMVAIGGASHRDV